MVGEHPLDVVVAALQISVVIVLPMKLGNVQVTTRDSLKVFVKIIIWKQSGVVLFRVLNNLFEVRILII
jgi:hypothetical protein